MSIPSEAFTLARISLRPYGGDFSCPHCSSDIEFQWTTEYGDPVDGDWAIKCPACNIRLKVNVNTVITYTPEICEQVTD